jgi:hypothetical protein
LVIRFGDWKINHHHIHPMSSNIFVPTDPKNPTESWRLLLADPEKHWREGYSAKMLAEAWEKNKDFPPSFQAALKSSGLDLELVFGFPEFKVELDNAKRPSQNDLFLVARDIEGLYAISVEGKMNENFDLEIEKWNEGQSIGKDNRFDFLLNKLGLRGGQADFAKHRYQLFHRTASAILMAEKLHAKSAMMVVHSFSKTKNHFSDFEAFVQLFSPNRVVKPGEIFLVRKFGSNVDLYLGWINGDTIDN